MRITSIVAIAFLVGCTEVTVSPSPIDFHIEQPTTTTSAPPSDPVPTPPREDPGTPVSLILDPPSVEGTAPSSVVVKVIAVDSTGTEIPSVSLTVSGLDPAVATLKGVDGRFVSFSLKAPGVTTAIITAAGAQTSLVITVN